MQRPQKTENEGINPPDFPLPEANEAILQQYRLKSWFFILVYLTGSFRRHVIRQPNSYSVLKTFRQQEATYHFSFFVVGFQVRQGALQSLTPGIVG
jgi:hypothetical protein